MRRLQCALLAAVAVIGAASIASAADMPVKAPVYKAPVMAPLYDWNGFYVGGHVGGGWSNASVSDPTGANFAPAGSSIGINGSGVLGGGQAGFNWQTGRWVLGVQGDFAWTGINPSVTDPFIPTATIGYKTDWIGMATARAGYAWDNWLLYVKGGAAWVHNSYSAVDPRVRIGFNASGADTRTGWVLGGGLEYGLARNWTAFVEYDYVGLGTHTVTLTDPTLGAFPASINQNINIVKAGVNYKFGM